MCRYITYILPKAADEGAVAEAFGQMQIRLKRYPSHLLLPFLKADEHAWIRRNDCDCSTPIGEAQAEPDTEFNLSEAEKRYRRKGWNETKIQRALTDMQHRSSVPREPRVSLADVVARCLADPTIPYMRVSTTTTQP